MILFLLGIGCFLIGLFTFSQAAYIETLVSCASGIWLFILGMNLRRQNHIANASKKPEPTQPTAPIKPEPEPTPIIPTQEQKQVKQKPKKSGKYITSLTFKVAGVTFDCECGDDYATRQEALADSETTDTLILEPYTFRSKPAFYIINKRLGCDIGNVPATHTAQINELYKKYDLVGKFTKLDSFAEYEEDEDGEPDYTFGADYTYFARVQFKAYEKTPDSWDGTKGLVR